MTENLEQQFKNIRQDRSEFDRTQLPQNLELPIDEHLDSKGLLELATAFWQKIYNHDEFLQVLRRYIRMSVEQKANAAAEKQYFKKLRKAGLIYKSAFRFGDARRNLPDDMDNFLVKLGELGDYFAHDRGQEVAFDLLSIASEKSFSKPVDEIVATDIAEVNTRIEWIVNKCLGFLAEQKLDINDFHKMRKLLRHVMNLYQIAAVAKQDNLNIQQSFQFICDLNSLLGDEHDEVVKKDIAGKAKYEDQSVVLEIEKRQKVVLLLEKLNQALIQSRLSHVG